jgi:disulfide bond formation protein DsbB
MNDLVAAFDHMKRNEPVRLAAGAVAILGLAAILGAWFFQIVIGLPPCPLCLEQRYAYYFSIPLAVLVLLGVSYGASRKVLIAALAVIALGMAWNAGLGAYHAGVEWKFWEGPGIVQARPISALPAVCSTNKMIRCALRRNPVELPRYLAGYNAIISLVLSLIAAWGAWAAYRTLPPPEKLA